MLAIVVVGGVLVDGCGGTHRAAVTRSTTAAARTATRAAGAAPTPAFTPDPAAVALVSRMPLGRQVAQLFLVDLDGAPPPTLGALDWGGVVFTSFGSDAEAATNASTIAAASPAGGRTPPLLAIAQAGGPGTALRDLPPKAEPDLGAGGNSDAARSEALLAAHKLRALGFNMTLAPLADVDIPDGPYTGRLFGSDPAVVARFTTAALGGYNAGKLIAAAAHFPGAGAASADPDQMTATVGGSLAQLRARDLIPFAAAARSAPVIMLSNAAYAAFDGVTPASLLPQAVTLLRHGYGFGGVVMSGDLDATLAATGERPATVALQALRAGDDLLYISGPPTEREAAYEAILTAAQRSPAVMSEVHEAVLRDLSLKARYGILSGHPRTGG